MTVTERQSSWTIGGLLDWTARHLAQKGAESPRLDAEVLLAHALACQRIELYTRYEEVASDQARASFRDLVRQRLEGCPVAYLVGRKEFFSLQFAVTRDVLIPRPESEFVVLECLRLARTFDGPQVLDIGTGSGNLAIAVAHQHKTARVTAVDVSPGALVVAAANARRLQVEGRIRFLKGDLFGPLGGERFDFIVSNPPYIAREEIDQLPIGVRDYEPHTALDGGPGGFAVFDRLVEEGRGHLVPGGHLIVEIGAPQHERARERIASFPEYELAETILDGSRHPRVLRARFAVGT
jgi:release factor glutamine methyltransferase